MKRMILVGAVLAVGAIYYLASTTHLHRAKTMTEQKLHNEIDRNEAIKIAQQHAMKANLDLTSYTATCCLAGLTWRVYFGPVTEQDLNEVFEYAIARTGGFVAGVTRLSGLKSGIHSSKSAVATINQADAIAIAKKDAVRASNLSNKKLTVCELKNFWRIIYSPPIHLNGGGPEYLIDKRTGVITDKKYYQ